MKQISPPWGIKRAGVTKSALNLIHLCHPMRIERPHPLRQGTRAKAGVVPDRYESSTPGIHNEAEQIALANVLTKLKRGRLHVTRPGRQSENSDDVGEAGQAGQGQL